MRWVAHYFIDYKWHERSASQPMNVPKLLIPVRRRKLVFNKVIFIQMGGGFKIYLQPTFGVHFTHRTKP